MRIILTLSTLVTLAFAMPAGAEPLIDLHDEATTESDRGASLLSDADWQFRDGNVQEGCRIMEQARVHFEQAYNDLNAMQAMIQDPANGYSDADQEKTMDWISQQKDIAGDIGGKMADTYFAKCQ